jgi:hypothetical protein
MPRSRSSLSDNIKSSRRLRERRRHNSISVKRWRIFSSILDDIPTRQLAHSEADQRKSFTFAKIIYDGREAGPTSMLDTSVEIIDAVVGKFICTNHRPTGVMPPVDDHATVY